MRRLITSPQNYVVNLWSASPTVVVLNFVQEADAVQMFGRGHREGKDITNGLVESRVGSVTEGHRLIFVLQEVLDVAHLVVHRDQVVHSHNSALFDPGDENKGRVTATSHTFLAPLHYIKQVI